LNVKVIGFWDAMLGRYVVDSNVPKKFAAALHGRTMK
jgi:hypothetical protein